MQTKEIDWQTVELLAQAHYSNLGYRVLVPLVRNHGYDFVVEKGGVFLRVNAKKAGLKTRSNQNSWSISQAGGMSKGHRELRGTVDRYIVYLPMQGRFIELMGDFLDGGNSKSKLIPKNIFLS